MHRRFDKRRYGILVVLGLGLFSGSKIRAANVALAWDSVTATNLGGYYLYYGNASHNYTYRIDTGTNTAFTVSNLQAGATCYFAVSDRTIQGVESSYSSETVYTPPVAPAITSQPASRTNVIGTSATFTVSASGTPLYYQWFVGSTLIPGARYSTLTRTNLHASDAGDYSVIVSNTLGVVTSSPAVLTMVASSAPTVAPAITGQPSSRTNIIGTATTFTVSATGNPLSYQWFKGTTPISGARFATLTRTNLHASDAGSYSVTVSNAMGNVTSSAAILTMATTNATGSITSLAINALPASAATLLLTPSTIPGGPVGISFAVVMGYAYQLQASADLQSWTTLWQSDPVPADEQLEFTDSNAGSIRFYRVLVQ